MENSVIEKKKYLSRRDISTFTVEDSVESIGDWAFANCINLKTIRLPRGIKLGRGVFKGCKKLTNICIADRGEDDLSYLLAACAVRLPAQYLLVDEEVGSAHWLEKWDLALSSYINQSDLEGYTNQVLCGEEDISTDGIKSVDGELLGESSEYVKNMTKNKCYLCFLRLMHKEGLSKENGKKLCEYIKNSPVSWTCILEDFDELLDYCEMYVNIIKPSASEVDEMIGRLGNKHTQIKSYLISLRSGMDVDMFGELML